MWLKHEACTRLTVYKQCIKRYIHHAIDDDWNKCHEEYMLQHRDQLQKLIRSLEDRIEGSSDDFPAYDHACLFNGKRSFYVSRLLAMAVFNRFSPQHWFPDDVFKRILGTIASFDRLFCRAVRPTNAELLAIRGSFSYMGSDIVTLLIGSSCSHNVDLWPTDSVDANIEK